MIPRALLFVSHQTLTSPIAMATHYRSLHALLSSGAVVDVLLWQRRNALAATVVGVTAVWFLFEHFGYNFLSVMSNTLHLLVAILFFWSKSTSLLNRPLPPLPNLVVSDVVVDKVADQAVVWINRVLATTMILPSRETGKFSYGQWCTQDENGGGAIGIKLS